MRIIEEFWYGNIGPTEYDTSSCKEYKKLLIKCFTSMPKTVYDAYKLPSPRGDKMFQQKCTETEFRFCTCPTIFCREYRKICWNELTKQTFYRGFFKK